MNGRAASRSTELVLESIAAAAGLISRNVGSDRVSKNPKGTINGPRFHLLLANGDVQTQAKKLRRDKLMVESIALSF